MPQHWMRPSPGSQGHLPDFAAPQSHESSGRRYLRQLRCRRLRRLSASEGSVLLPLVVPCLVLCIPALGVFLGVRRIACSAAAYVSNGPISRSTGLLLASSSTPLVLTLNQYARNLLVSQPSKPCLDFTVCRSRYASVTPGVISARRGVPSSIARPEYVDRPTPAKYTGPEVKDAETIQKNEDRRTHRSSGARGHSRGDRPGSPQTSFDRVGHEYMLDHGAYPRRWAIAVP